MKISTYYLPKPISLFFSGGPMDGLQMSSHIPPIKDYYAYDGVSRYHGYWDAIGSYRYLYVGKT